MAIYTVLFRSSHRRCSKRRCCLKFRKIDKKAPVPESLTVPESLPVVASHHGYLHCPILDFPYTLQL